MKLMSDNYLNNNNVVYPAFFQTPPQHCVLSSTIHPLLSIACSSKFPLQHSRCPLLQKLFTSQSVIRSSIPAFWITPLLMMPSHSTPLARYIIWFAFIQCGCLFVKTLKPLCQKSPRSSFKWKTVESGLLDILFSICNKK